MAQPLLTLFAIPRAFSSSVGEHQKNAIRSWLSLPGKNQIILLGDDEGVKEACQEFGLLHIPDIRKNEYGTYFLDDAFEKAAKESKGSYICYMNADIIFTEKTISALESILKQPLIGKTKDFLAIGQRWDFDTEAGIFPKIGTEHKDWSKELIEYAHKHGTMHPPWGSDFFIFPRTTELEMPPFVVGRPYWDNWMIYHFRQRNIPVIDITKYALAFHQNHDYMHVAGSGTSNTGPEADANRSVIKNVSPADIRMNLLDASYVLTAEGNIKKNLSPYAIWRKFRFLAPVRLAFSGARFLLGPTGSAVRLALIALVISSGFLYAFKRYGRPEFNLFYGAIIYFAIMQIYMYFQTKKSIENEGVKTRRQIRKIGGQF